MEVGWDITRLILWDCARSWPFLMEEKVGMKYETQGVMSINALAITGDKKGIWFIHGTLPLLLRYDFNSQEIVKVAVIPCSTKGMLQQALFKGI